MLGDDKLDLRKPKTILPLYRLLTIIHHSLRTRGRSEGEASCQASFFCIFLQHPKETAKMNNIHLTINDNNKIEKDSTEADLSFTYRIIKLTNDLAFNLPLMAYDFNLPGHIPKQILAVLKFMKLMKMQDILACEITICSMS